MSSTANIQAALDEAGKVVKKQKTCEAKVDSCLDQLIDLVGRSRQELLAPDCLDPDVVMSQLHQQIESMGLSKEMNAQTKDLHTAIAKLSKALDKAFDNDVDICKAMRDVQFDQATLNQVIAEHFYREGRFSIGDLFAAEAGIADTQPLKQPYVAMHSILKQIQQHNLDPVLAWAVEHRQQLSSDGSPSAFEFKLHALNFVHILSSQGQMPALAYAKRQFPPFQKRHMRDIQRCMGCLLFAGRPSGGGAESPYAELLSPALWDDTARDFTKQACSLMGQAYESPLATVVAAGSVALPQLLKLAAVMEKNQQDLKSCSQLPMEIELGPEFVFHSIFACPVSREGSTPDNPPMLLPCGHVLCEQSVVKIAKTRARSFKCPYCPQEARADSLRVLHFPDIE